MSINYKIIVIICYFITVNNLLAQTLIQDSKGKDFLYQNLNGSISVNIADKSIQIGNFFRLDEKWNIGLNLKGKSNGSISSLFTEGGFTPSASSSLVLNYNFRDSKETNTTKIIDQIVMRNNLLIDELLLPMQIYEKKYIEDLNKINIPLGESDEIKIKQKEQIKLQNNKVKDFFENLLKILNTLENDYIEKAIKNSLKEMFANLISYNPENTEEILVNEKIEKFINIISEQRKYLIEQNTKYDVKTKLSSENSIEESYINNLNDARIQIVNNLKSYSDNLKSKLDSFNSKFSANMHGKFSSPNVSSLSLIGNISASKFTLFDKSKIYAIQLHDTLNYIYSIAFFYNFYWKKLNSFLNFSIGINLNDNNVEDDLDEVKLKQSSTFSDSLGINKRIVEKDIVAYSGDYNTFTSYSIKSAFYSRILDSTPFAFSTYTNFKIANDNPWLIGVGIYLTQKDKNSLLPLIGLTYEYNNILKSDKEYPASKRHNVNLILSIPIDFQF
ncbi:MAG: hypothetical protein JSS63_01325 [Bacteroidetes bacterium]|nr:hypothetical protein [Bacteroidota bacterium]